MRKFQKIAAILALAIAIAPAAALAHEKDAKIHSNNGLHLGWFKNRPEIKRVLHAGSVTEVGSASFDFVTKNSQTFTANVTADTKIMNAKQSVLALADIHVGDRVWVKGEISGTNVAAKVVLVTPANTHPAAAVGSVSAVSGSTITVESGHMGVPHTVTVSTDADTTVQKSDGTAGTMTDITAGATVKVRGLWDEVQNILRAIKIVIK